MLINGKNQGIHYNSEECVYYLNKVRMAYIMYNRCTRLIIYEYLNDYQYSYLMWDVSGGLSEFTNEYIYCVFCNNGVIIPRRRL